MLPVTPQRKRILHKLMPTHAYLMRESPSACLWPISKSGNKDRADVHIVLQVPLVKHQWHHGEARERERDSDYWVCVCNTFYIVYKSVYNPQSTCGIEQGERERTELSLYPGDMMGAHWLRLLAT